MEKMFEYIRANSPVLHSIGVILENKTNDNGIVGFAYRVFVYQDSDKSMEVEPSGMIRSEGIGSTLLEAQQDLIKNLVLIRG